VEGSEGEQAGEGEEVGFHEVGGRGKRFWRLVSTLGKGWVCKRLRFFLRGGGVAC
jgi:hypothetical protein